MTVDPKTVTPMTIDAVKNFSTLAGPVINGYAFCDWKKQQAIRTRALDWVAGNPY